MAIINFCYTALLKSKSNWRAFTYLFIYIFILNKHKFEKKKKNKKTNIQTLHKSYKCFESDKNSCATIEFTEECYLLKRDLVTTTEQKGEQVIGRIII